MTGAGVFGAAADEAPDVPDSFVTGPGSAASSAWISSRVRACVGAAGVAIAVPVRRASTSARCSRDNWRDGVSGGLMRCARVRACSCVGNDCEHTLHQPFGLGLVAGVELPAARVAAAGRPSCASEACASRCSGCASSTAWNRSSALRPSGASSRPACNAARARDSTGSARPVAAGCGDGRHRRCGDCRRLRCIRLAADEERDDQRERHQADQDEVPAGHASGRAAQAAQQRQQRVAGFASLAALDVPADRGLQEHARPAAPTRACA